MNSLILSPKFKAFLRCNAQLEALEGTTAAGKTTVGAYKFICKVMASPKQLHILAADDVGAAEKNIIQKDLGIASLFPLSLVDYRGNGSAEYKMPHLIVHTTRGDKIVFIIGYRDRARWKDALGGQYGCLYIDEVNTANLDFVREAVMRADYTMMTLNPDDPNLPVYSEYINHCRPLAEWAHETPVEIIQELREEPKPGWVHWFFSFEHNKAMSAEMKQRIISSTPKGTKIWKNKIQGLRGKATGLIFPNFDRARNVVKPAEIHQDVKAGRITFRKFTVGVDTAYSQKSPDTISMLFEGFTTDRKVIILDEAVFQNRDRTTPLAPSDVVEKLLAFADRNTEEWGLPRDIFVDSADQATLQELRKWKRLKGSVYEFWDSYKRVAVIDRIKLMLGWIQQGEYLVCEHCIEHLREIDTYSWQEDKDVPEDRNDHTINASQYGWIPERHMIGFEDRK